MNYLYTLILGIIHGVTEFLPVSSSGHLAIAEMLMNVEEGNIVLLAAVLHFGTLISVCFVYRDDLKELSLEFLRMLKDIIQGKGVQSNKNYHRRLGLFLIVATIPTAIGALLFNQLVKSSFTSFIAIGIGLLVTGVLIWFAEKSARGDKDIYKMTFKNAFLIGLLQTFALAPGVSRSGTTFAGSLLSGLNRELTIKFSFILSIPIILAVSLIETTAGITQGLNGLTIGNLLVGVLVASIAGYIAIKTMIKFVTKKKLYYFSYYTWLIGSIIIITVILV